MTERLLTPSKITAWLDCGHYLTLQHQLESGLRNKPKSTFGEFAELLMQKGIAHEEACLAQYKAEGKSVFEVPARDRPTNESFQAWVERIGNPMADGYDVIYQMPFIHDGVRGIADFLIREPGDSHGAWRYEPLDAKLARKSAKPGHVLQLCFYADAITELTGHTPEILHVWLGSDEVEKVRLSDVDAYWRRMKTQLKDVMNADQEAETKPIPCSHCDFCEFSEVCTQQWRNDDALHFVAGLRPADTEELAKVDVTKMEQLAACTSDVEVSIKPERLKRLIQQATIQKQASVDAPPPFELIEQDDEPGAEEGFATLPAPDNGDVFLDYEGHPFWTAQEEIFFLFGLIAQAKNGEWAFEGRWAHTKDEECRETLSLINYLHNRRQEFPNMHVYHYNHTERSSLVRLAEQHNVGESMLNELIETGIFVDLYPVVTKSLIIGAESYGLKNAERLAEYQRGHEIDKGAGAVVEYEKYMADRDTTHLDRIARYNEDDVRATRALRDWLLAQRPTDIEWRDAQLELAGATLFEVEPAIAELLERFPDPEAPEHLLADLLGYWRREWIAVKGKIKSKDALDFQSQLSDGDVITGLDFEEELAKTGRQVNAPMRFSFPTQEIEGKLKEKGSSKVSFFDADGAMYSATLQKIDIPKSDEHTGNLILSWTPRPEEPDFRPSSIILNDYLSVSPKDKALLALANQVLDLASNGEPNPASMALLRNESPKFTLSSGPRDGAFTDTVDDLRVLALHLDGSYLPIQGPPGTGKTYTGARMVLELVKAGKSVGVTAMSHHAIENFLKGVIDAFEEAGESHLLQVLSRVPNKKTDTETITYLTSNNIPKGKEFNVFTGTTWFFSNDAMVANPVDVLFIDEAGQLSLADAMAASTSARNLVLLGDPQQLPQVAQGTHSKAAGASVLQHVLGQDQTIKPSRGAFLSTTWRMHPEVCSFISKQIYEGHLKAHTDCANQSTDMGTGLRWIEAEHKGCSTESLEESALVVEAIGKIIGQTFTDKTGKQQEIAAEHIMVVAPYNAQVNRLRGDLGANPLTADVKVGTVDKFQGQEAPIVFFTMTASTSKDIPRGADFLFSKNRLNVAISRAQAIAYLVCTKDLLDSRARDIETMKLISTLCAFVEHAT